VLTPVTYAFRAAAFLGDPNVCIATAPCGIRYRHVPATFPVRKHDHHVERDKIHEVSDISLQLNPVSNEARANMFNYSTM
jgi:hypothetical protein